MPALTGEWPATGLPVDHRGIEPRLQACKARVLPLSLAAQVISL